MVVVVAAIMSTVDSLLVLAASAVVRDIYQKIYRPELADAALVVPVAGAAVVHLHRQVDGDGAPGLAQHLHQVGLEVFHVLARALELARQASALSRIHCVNANRPLPWVCITFRPSRSSA